MSLARKFLLSLSLGTLLLTACKSTPPGETTAPSQADSGAKNSATDTPKSFIADISGEVNQHFVATNDQVNIGFMPTGTKGEFRFNVSGIKEGSTQTVEVGTGIDGSFHFTPGLEQRTGGARYSVTTDNGEVAYTDMAYPQYFATSDDGKDDAYIVLSKVEKLPSKNSLLARYHLIGTFRFNGGYAPEPMDEGCAKEAGMYAGQHGKRNPPFRADLCKAKKIHVNGSFDIVQDFIAAAF